MAPPGAGKACFLADGREGDALGRLELSLWCRAQGVRFCLFQVHVQRPQTVCSKADEDRLGVEGAGGPEMEVIHERMRGVSGVWRGGAIEAEGVRRLVLPGVRTCAPFEEGILCLWMGGLAARPLGGCDLIKIQTNANQR